MDIPMPAGPAEGTRATDAPWKTWVEERRRPVIAGAFVGAALLGVLIGLVTAPAGSTSTTDTADVTAATARSPQLPALPWEGSRAPGTAVKMVVAREPGLRPALSWAAADAALAAAGKPTLSQLAASGASTGSRAAQAGSGGGSLTADSITIEQGIYYGAIEETSDATDQFWAVGVAETSSTAVPLPRLTVWERVGSGPWTVVASGSGACQKLPTALYGANVWGSRPEICSGSTG
jgi:hypothetical protein